MSRALSLAASLARRRVLAAALALSAAGGVLAAPSAGAEDDVVLRGTLFGADGRSVSALLGFDLRDAQGRALGASGCVRSPSCPVEGYAVTRRVNFDLGATGGDPSDWSESWSVRLPAEAERVYVEAFPQGRRYAGTDTSRYAPSFRRNVPVRSGVRVNVRLPLVCGAKGGPGVPGTGRLAGYAVEAGSDRPVPLRRLTAFSLERDDNGPTPVLGMGVGRVEPNGYYEVEDLASGVAKGQRAGQRYQLVATAKDGRVERVYRDVRVTTCTGQRVDIVFGDDRR